MSRKSNAWIARVVVGATIATGLSVVAPAAANALEGCPAGYLCTWRDDWFWTQSGHEAAKFSMYIPNYSGHFYGNTSFGASNTATSILNAGRYDTAFMYAGINKRDRLFEIPVGNSNGLLFGYQNDNIESGYFATYN